MGDRAWHDQGDYQYGRIDGKSVVLARGGTFAAAHTRREDLPLWVMATCTDGDHALRIIAALSTPTEEDVCGSCGKDHSEDPLCTN